MPRAPRRTTRTKATASKPGAPHAKPSSEGFFHARTIITLLNIRARIPYLFDFRAVFLYPVFNMLGLLAHLAFSQPNIPPIEHQYCSIQTSYKSALEALHQAKVRGDCGEYELAMLENLVADLEAALRRLEPQRGTALSPPHASDSGGLAWQ